MRLSPTEPIGHPPGPQLPLRQPQLPHPVTALTSADSLQHTTSLPLHPHQFTLLSRELHGESVYPQPTQQLSQQLQQQPINLSESGQERSSFGPPAPHAATADQARLPYVLDAAAASASSAFRGSPNWPLSVARHNEQLGHPGQGAQRLLGPPQPHQEQQHHHHQNPHPEPHAPRYLPDFSQT